MENLKPDQNILDMTNEVLKQNKMILEINQLLIKFLAYPRYVIKKDSGVTENDITVR